LASSLLGKTRNDLEDYQRRRIVALAN
jgi:hypothetical protein